MLPRSGIQRRVVRMWTDVSKERITSIFRPGPNTLLSCSADLRHKRLRWYVSPKRLLTYGPHCAMSQDGNDHADSSRKSRPTGRSETTDLTSQHFSVSLKLFLLLLVLRSHLCPRLAFLSERLTGRRLLYHLCPLDSLVFRSFQAFRNYTEITSSWICNETALVWQYYASIL
jgi:hypothetical protein